MHSVPSSTSGPGVSGESPAKTNGGRKGAIKRSTGHLPKFAASKAIDNELHRVKCVDAPGAAPSVHQQTARKPTSSKRRARRVSPATVAAEYAEKLLKVFGDWLHGDRGRRRAANVVCWKVLTWIMWLGCLNRSFRTRHAEELPRVYMRRRSNVLNTMIGCRLPTCRQRLRGMCRRELHPRPRHP